MTTETKMAIAELQAGPATIELARRISRTQPRSERWEPLVKAPDVMPDGAEIWENRIYQVTLRRFKTDWPLAPAGANWPWDQIGISSKDGMPRHDWREFQQIKNQLSGPNWEAIELYPAESRLLDPSNYYMLWCAPKIPIGKYDGRCVVGVENCCAPQRGWK